MMTVGEVLIFLQTPEMVAMVDQDMGMVKILESISHHPYYALEFLLHNPTQYALYISAVNYIERMKA